jgi:low temperature requirement protein LtrA
MTSPLGQLTAPDRVSTLELFFDLVFVFTITQLTGILARQMSIGAAVEVVLVFGVLWWMYGAYAWLTNTRTPVRAPERLLLLLGMAGFLIIGLSIPHAFDSAGVHDRDGVALGIGYLVVILVHGGLYLRVNKNFQRVLPVNLLSALLVIAAGFVPSAPRHALWAAALATQALSPLVIKPGGLFTIAPAHFVERHGALIIVAFGESVADIGIGASDQAVTFSLALSAVLGLTLTAALWWAFFGTGDDDRAEAAMTAADLAARPQLALNAYFYAYIPILLGIIAAAAGLKHAIEHPGAALPSGPALALAGGVTLFLAGDVAFRHALRIGPLLYRAGAAAAALVAWPVAVASSAAAGIIVLTVVVAAALAAEGRGQHDTVET